jgi:hypothetical protein
MRPKTGGVLHSYPEPLERAGQGYYGHNLSGVNKPTHTYHKIGFVHAHQQVRWPAMFARVRQVTLSRADFEALAMGAS